MALMSHALTKAVNFASGDITLLLPAGTTVVPTDACGVAETNDDDDVDIVAGFVVVVVTGVVVVGFSSSSSSWVVVT